MRLQSGRATFQEKNRLRNVDADFLKKKQLPVVFTSPRSFGTFRRRESRNETSARRVTLAAERCLTSKKDIPDGLVLALQDSKLRL
jgi:hypothetical protein